MLIGVFLAIAAFIGVIMLAGNPSGGPTATPPVEGPVVVATVDLPLSS